MEKLYEDFLFIFIRNLSFGLKLKYFQGNAGDFKSVMIQRLISFQAKPLEFIHFRIAIMTVTKISG